MSYKDCRLRSSTQHLLAVYSQEFQSLRSFSDVDSSAARPGLAALEKKRTGRFFEGSIARSRRLVFSFVPRCQGLCGSQK
jgi:hypothetical protein